jgi:hypothetical protein
LFKHPQNPLFDDWLKPSPVARKVGKLQGKRGEGILALRFVG